MITQQNALCSLVRTSECLSIYLWRKKGSKWKRCEHASGIESFAIIFADRANSNNSNHQPQFQGNQQERQLLMLIFQHGIYANTKICTYSTHPPPPPPKKERKEMKITDYANIMRKNRQFLC